MAYFAYCPVDAQDGARRRRVQGRGVIKVASADLAARLTKTNAADWVETFLDHPTERFASIGSIFDARQATKFERDPEWDEKERLKTSR